MGAKSTASYSMCSRKFGNSEPDRNTPCPLCGEVALLEQDHNHETDLCRGRICHSCNIVLGRYDRPVAEIQRFLDYLAHWERVHATDGGRTYTEYMREMNPTYRLGRKGPRRRKDAA